MKLNQLKAGAILSYVSMGLGYTISIIYTPIMLRLLGQSEYGLYNLVSSVVSYLGLLSFGFGSAYMRYYSRFKVKEEEENIKMLNGMFFIVFFIIGLVSLLAGSILVLNTEAIFGDKLTVDELSTAKVLMGIMVVNIAISFPASVFNSYVTANEQYIFQKVVEMIRIIVNPLVMLPVLMMGYRSIGMVVVSTILNIVVEVANVFFCFYKLNMKFSFSKFDISLMKEISIFSSYIFINMIVDQINWNLDKFIIGRFKGTIEVAIYGIAAQFNSYYMSIATVISNVFIPRVNRMIANNCSNTELTNLFTRIGRIQFIILSLICSGFVFFGRAFINLWAGAEYDGSYFITLILIIPATLSLTQTIGIEIQRAKNIHQFRSWLYFFISICNLLISIPLTKNFGGVGAAMGTSIAIIIGNVFIMNWYYYIKVGIDVKYYWNEIFTFVPSLIVPIILGILIKKLININTFISFIVFGFVYVMIFFISLWFFGMDEYEKELITNPIKRLLNKL